MDRPGWCGPHIKLLEVNSPTVDYTVTRSANAEVNREGVLAPWLSALARFQNAQRDSNPRRQTITGAGCRTGNQRDSTAIRGARSTRKAGNLCFDFSFGD